MLSQQKFCLILGNKIPTVKCSPKVIFLNENQFYKDSCHIKFSYLESSILIHFEDLALGLFTKYYNFLGFNVQFWPNI